MSEKKKPTTTKKTTAKSSSAKAAPKKSKAAKTSTTKKTTPAKKTATKKSTAAKPKTTAAKKSAAAKKPSTTKKVAKKTPTSIKAQIVSYRRSNRLQKTNQAVAKVLDDYNHKALVGRKFSIKFSTSDAIAKGIVVSTHGRGSNKQIRLRFTKGGMAGQAINQIAEIEI